MRRLILGTAGHIDHGKTTLVRALTGIDTDRLPEEKRRGITIDLGFAHLPLDNGLELGIVDVPGHEAFIRNMLAGATGIDIVLLVVAADEGIMPQTREHLSIVELLGTRAGVVALTKIDAVDPEWRELVAEDLRNELAGGAFGAAPVIPVSGITGEGLDELRRALAATAAAVDERSADDLFRLPVDRAFSVRGTGTVVTGTVWSGRLTREQAVRVLPAGAPARLRGLQVHGCAVDEVRAGQRAALALAGFEREQVGRGDTLVSGDGWQATFMITARLRLLAGAPRALRTRQRVRFHLGTTEVMARVALLDAEQLDPGAEAWAQLRLEAPVVARTGDRFVIRSYSPMTTIGGGTVAEPAPGKRKALPSDVRSALMTILEGGADRAVLASVGLRGWRGAAEHRLPVETPLSPAEVDAALTRQVAAGEVVREGALLLAREVVGRARDLVLQAVERSHRRNELRPGIDRDELRRALPPHAAVGLADRVIAELTAEGRLTIRGGLVARAGFAPTLTPGQQAALQELRAAFDSAGLAPPSLGELSAGLRERPDFWPLLKLLEQEAVLVALTGELWIARDALDGAVSAVRRQLGGREGLTPADFKEVLGVSRKHLIPLLEHFDRSGVTLRRGESRALRPA